MGNPTPQDMPASERGIDDQSSFYSRPPAGSTLDSALYALLCAEGAFEKTLKRRTIMAREGASQEGLIAILDGLIKLSTSWPDGRTQILGLRFPGEFITLRTQAEPWFATVEAVEDTTLLVLEASKAEYLRLDNMRFNMGLSGHIDREIAAAQAHLVTLGRRSPIERLASLLIEFKDRGLGASEASGEIRIPISRDEIGDYIGLESETVSRQFTRLKSEGYISLISPSRVVVRDWRALFQLRNGERSLAAE